MQSLQNATRVSWSVLHPMVKNRGTRRLTVHALRYNNIPDVVVLTRRAVQQFPHVLIHIIITSAPLQRSACRKLLPQPMNLFLQARLLAVPISSLLPQKCTLGRHAFLRLHVVRDVLMKYWISLSFEQYWTKRQGDARYDTCCWRSPADVEEYEQNLPPPSLVSLRLPSPCLPQLVGPVRASV